MDLLFEADDALSKYEAHTVWRSTAAGTLSVQLDRLRNTFP
jgi:hypothetical protein